MIVRTLGLAALGCFVVQAEHTKRPYIAFAAMPFKGHATPIHALAQELSARGYETDFITMDSPAFTDIYACAAGPRYISLFPFDSVCSAENLHLALLMATGAIPESELSPAQGAAVWRCFLGYYEDFLPAIMDRFVQRRPDLVVSDYFTLGAIVSIALSSWIIPVDTVEYIQDAALNLSIPLIINSPTVFSTDSFNLPTGWSKYHSWGAKDLKSGGLLASFRRWLNHVQRRYFCAIAAENPVVLGHRQMRSVAHVLHTLTRY